jgi:predicted secreted Zn-dependent protease
MGHLVRRVILSAALLGAAAIVSGATPATDDAFAIEYYRIQGATARELREQINRLGPVSEAGVRGDAYTEYRVSWTFSLRMNDRHHCAADNVQVDLRVRMFLPQWDQPPDASAELIRTWDQFSTVLREHEDGHYRLAIDASWKVREALRSRTHAAGCDALKARLNDMANDVLARYRRKQADYDQRTDFGRAQGTRLL